MNWPEDFINKIICGDNLSVMKKMPDECIDMAITSPPYWGLRDYGFEQIFGGDPDCEHKWNSKNKKVRNGISGAGTRWQHKEAHNIGPNEYDITKCREGEKKIISESFCLKCQAWKGQLGLEPTPEFYIEHLTEIFNEVKRILKKEGTFWLNMGDTYNSQGTNMSRNWDGRDKNLDKGKPMLISRDIPAKCLLMIPERLAWSLIQNGWILRNKIIWHKKNHMPSSVKDRFTNTWEYLFLFSKNKKYYFDLDAIRKPYTEPLNRWGGEKIDIPKKTKWKSDDEKAKWAMSVRERQSRPNQAGKNPGDVWIINTQSFPDAHFAVFPEKLCEKPIKAGCPEEICKKCGKARERIIKINYVPHRKSRHFSEPSKERMKAGGASVISKGVVCNKITQTIGWTDCNCKAGFESGIVLDPFCGVGTALYVAKELRRRYIGIDIKKEYCELAEKRLAQGVL